MKQIFDIFSKTKKQKTRENPKQKIIVDYREKNSLIISAIMRLGIEIEFKELKVADYIVKDVAIERKTVSDFVTSMINKRLFNQIQELGQYKNKLLMIEGIEEQELYTDNEVGVNGNAIRGFLLSILLKYNIPIIFTKNFEDSAKFISVLCKKKDKELSLNVTKKNLSKKERLQFILESFPGIGPITSKKILKKFKTIQGIINASAIELKEEIGKKADSIIHLRESHYWIKPFLLWCLSKKNKSKNPRNAKNPTNKNK